MSRENPEVKLLNEVLQKQSPFFYRILSNKGKGCFFPNSGILTQSAEAKGKRINATAGIALDEDQALMHLSSLQKGVNLLPHETSSYAPSQGLLELRELWKEKQNCSFLTSLPLVTCGLTHSLSLVSFLFVDAGDEVVLPDLHWENYRLIFEQRQEAVINTYPLFKESKFNLAGFREAVLNGSSNFNQFSNESNNSNNRHSKNPRKKIIVLNFPHNPTGYSPTEEEARQIVEILREAASAGLDLIVVCDDAYAGFVFQKGIRVSSLFHLLGNCHENILAAKADGASKELYAWGLRVAFLTYACKNSSQASLTVLEEKTAGAIRSSISSCSTLSQNLVVNALKWKKERKIPGRAGEAVGSGEEAGEKAEEEQQLKAILQKRHDLVAALLGKERYHEFFTPLPFNSGYFFCLQLSEKFPHQQDAEAVRKLLLEKYDTGVVALDNYLRIAYSSVSTQNLARLIENIYLACKEVIEKNN